MADANVSTPGATGATWQSLFNGYATQAWANGQFLKLAGTETQTVTGPVAFSGATTVPDVAAFTGKDALNALTAEGRYIKSVPASGGTNVRIMDAQSDSSGNLIASLLGGATNNYAPSSDGISAGDGGGGYYIKVGAILIQSFWVQSAWDGLVVPFPVAYLPGTIPIAVGSAGTTNSDWTGWFSVGQKSSGQTRITNTGIKLAIPSQNGANAGLVQQGDNLSVNITVMGRVA